jgi:hypothetical protein
MARPAGYARWPATRTPPTPDQLRSLHPAAPAATGTATRSDPRYCPRALTPSPGSGDATRSARSATPTPDPAPSPAAHYPPPPHPAPRAAAKAGSGTRGVSGHAFSPRESPALRDRRSLVRRSSPGTHPGTAAGRCSRSSVRQSPWRANVSSTSRQRRADHRDQGGIRQSRCLMRRNHQRRSSHYVVLSLSVTLSGGC